MANLMKTHIHYRIALPDGRPECSIYIADQHQMVVFAFRKLMSNYPHLNIVGYSGSGLEAIQQCRKLVPSLIIVDPYLSELGGVDFIRQIKRRFPEIRVIAYLSRRDDDKLLAFINAGVDAIVDKSEPVEYLLKAIHVVNEGARYFSPLNAFDETANQPVLDVPQLPNISNREKQILKLIAEGQRNKSISSLLSISVKTVETHRFNLMKKLNSHSIADLISWARKFNMI